MFFRKINNLGLHRLVCFTLVWCVYYPFARAERSVLMPSDSLLRCTPPPDTLVRCGDAILTNLNLAGLPGIPSMLHPNTRLVQLPTQQELSPCNTGIIRRSWQLVRDSGTVLEFRGPVCTQHIAVQSNPHYAIRFPADTTIACGDLSRVDSVYIQGNPCSFFTVNVQDSPSFSAVGSCYRIYRKYQIVNWCEFNGRSTPIQVGRDVDRDNQPGDEPVWVVRSTDGHTYFDRDTNPGNMLPTASGYWISSREDAFLRSNGYWEYSQIITILDGTPPRITAPDQTTVFGTRVDCTGDMNYSLLVSEACTPKNLDIKVSWDRDSDGVSDGPLQATLAGIYPRFRILARLPLGNHRMTIRIQDGCGNLSEKQVQVLVQDKRPPEFKCINSLILNLTPLASGQDADGDGDTDQAAVTLWADELISSPATDCSRNVKYSLHRAEWIEAGIEQPNPDKRFLILTCDDRPTVLIYIYAWDDSGNYSYCETFVLLNDAQGRLCPQVKTGSISGVVKLPGGTEIEGAILVLSGEKVAQGTSDTQGGYTFDGLKESGNYVVSGRLDTLCREGVSTHDIVKILRHILGEEPFTHPFQYIAADVDRSGSISIMDIIHIRRVVLGIDSCFTESPSWLLLKADFPYEPTGLPIDVAIPDRIYVNRLLGNVANVNFIAIKMGDVSGDVLTGAGSSIFFLKKGGPPDE